MSAEERFVQFGKDELQQLFFTQQELIPTETPFLYFPPIMALPTRSPTKPKKQRHYPPRRFANKETSVIMDSMAPQERQHIKSDLKNRLKQRMKHLDSSTEPYVPRYYHNRQPSLTINTNGMTSNDAQESPTKQFLALSPTNE